VLLTTCLNNVFALQAVITHNVFHAPEGSGLKPYLEMYWQIDPNTLLFDKKEGVFKGKIKTDIILSKSKLVLVEEHYILETAPTPDAISALAQRIMDLKRFSVDTGEYKLDIILTDDVKKGGEFKYSEYIKIPYTTGAFFSDIQLVDTLLPAKPESVFLRNDNMQIPLCSNFLNEEKKTLKYYAELYNSNQLTQAKEVKVFISKKENDNVIFGLAKNIAVNHTLLEVLEGKFSLSSLSSGNYYLNMDLYDDQKQELAHKSLFFQLINSSPVSYTPQKDTSTQSNGPKSSQSNYLDLNKTYLSKYTPEQIRAILKMLIPIAGPVERANINEFLKRPDDMYSRYFIYNFWMTRSSLNAEEEWKNYSEKIKIVNKLFSTSMLRGYESERGRIYLKYGEPTERIRVENEDGAYPYEVWQYNGIENQANVLFLFYRPGFIGSDQILLHSTFNGEKVNKNWRDYLYITGTSNSTNSRADQYFGSR
jgi:GWxTD domain-containing protein